MTTRLSICAGLLGWVLIAGCSSSSSPSAARTPSAAPASAAGSGGSEASPQLGEPGKLNACALVSQSMLEQVLNIAMPTGVEDDSTDDTFDGPTCNYEKIGSAEKVYGVTVQISAKPDIYQPDSNYDFDNLATRATAPGITRGFVISGDSGSHVLVVKDVSGVDVSINGAGKPKTPLFTSTQLQALVAAVAAKL